MERPRFDRPVPHGGYQWHYLDGVSDDGAWAIVVIAMIGNPFSPGYARARAKGVASDPLTYSTMNVALYGPARCRRWCLTERAIAPSDRGAHGVAMGASWMRWEHGALVVDLDERTSPTRRRVRGRVVLRPETEPDAAVALDGAREHLWWPVAPRGALEVTLEEPRVRFRGLGYHDANAGKTPLEETFDCWTWSRAHAADGCTLITYATTDRADVTRSHALEVDRRGGIAPIARLTAAPLGRTAWGIARDAHADVGVRPTVVRSLEDTPFYARSLIATHLKGEPVTAMLETLSADRLRARWVRFLVGFRMGRARDDAWVR